MFNYGDLVSKKSESNGNLYMVKEMYSKNMEFYTIVQYMKSTQEEYTVYGGEIELVETFAGVKVKEDIVPRSRRVEASLRYIGFAINEIVLDGCNCDRTESESDNDYLECVNCSLISDLKNMRNILKDEKNKENRVW